MKNITFEIKSMDDNKTYELGDHFEKFLIQEVESGKYSSPNEVIKSGLKLLEEKNKKIKAINEALDIGERSGKPVVFDNEKFKQHVKEKLS